MNLSTSQNNQWVGSSTEIEEALRKENADLDPFGQYAIDPIHKAASLFGAEEDILVTEDIRYFLRGMSFPLANLLIQSTGRPIVFNQFQ